VSGTVFIAGTKTPIAGATVTATVGGKGYGPVNADTSGNYTLSAVPVGAAVIQAVAPEFSTDERPVTLTAGQNAQGENLFLVAKPVVSGNSIAGTVVLTGDREDGLLFGGTLTLTQNGKDIQSTIAKDGAFVFDNVTATGDLRVVVTQLPAGYEQKASDGFVYNYEGKTVDNLTVRLTPTAQPDPTPAASGVNLLVIGLVVLVLAAVAVIVTLVVRRRRAVQ
jgi:hypothetical protein